MLRFDVGCSSRALGSLANGSDWRCGSELGPTLEPELELELELILSQMTQKPMLRG